MNAYRFTTLGELISTGVPSPVSPAPDTVPVTPEWVEAEIVRQTAIDRYHDTPGQIASRVRDLAGVPWRDYSHG